MTSGESIPELFVAIANVEIRVSEENANNRPTLGQAHDELGQRDHVTRERDLVHGNA